MKKLMFPLIFLVLLISSCSQQLDYETEGPFIIVTSAPAGPDDFRNLFSRNIAIHSDGKLLLYTEGNDQISIDENAPIFETKLQKEEVDSLQNLIEENDFWKMNENIEDVDSTDGVFIYITVYLTDGSKKVGGLNPRKPEFLEIEEFVHQFIEEEDYSKWKDEVTDYIFQIND